MRPGVSGRELAEPERPRPQKPGAPASTQADLRPQPPWNLPHQPLSPAPLLSVTPRRYPGLISAVLGLLPAVSPRPAPRGPAGGGHAHCSLDLLAERLGATRLPLLGGTVPTAAGATGWRPLALGPRPAAQGASASGLAPLFRGEATSKKVAQ